MAAVAIPHSPYTIGTMTNRRIPLSSVPNAANSPVRAVAAAASKRSRPLDFAREITYGQPPPAKKHIIEVKETQPRTPPPRRQLPAKEGAIFNRGPNGAQLTAFDKKLLAVKDNPAPAKPPRQEKAEESLESVRQWQRHYRKAFPNFVFYFESIPDESRKHISRQIAHFGAVSPLHSSTYLVVLGLIHTCSERRSSFPETLLTLSRLDHCLPKVLSTTQTVRWNPRIVRHPMRTISLARSIRPY